MSDIESIAVRVIELIPEIIEKKPELAFRMFEALRKYFVPLELFQEYLKKLDRIESKIDKLEADIAELRKDVDGLKKEVAELRRDVDGLKRDVASLKKDMSDVKASLDMLMLSLEEEARDCVSAWLSKYGITMEPRSEIMCGMEINLFDVSGDYVLLGDATVRAGPKVVEWIVNRARKLVRCMPEYRGKEFIIVIYAMYFAPAAIEKAKEHNVWLVSARKEYTEFKTVRISV